MVPLENFSFNDILYYMWGRSTIDQLVIKRERAAEKLIRRRMALGFTDWRKD
jgi:hypothetical protein